MSLWDTVMSDTVGVLWRASTGKPDPWTQNEITQNAINDCVSAGGNTADCTKQQNDAINAVLATPSLSWWGAFNEKFGNDDGSGCGFSNLGGCMPFDPSYLPWILGGAGVILVLWLLRPFVVAAEE